MKRRSAILAFATAVAMSLTAASSASAGDPEVRRDAAEFRGNALQQDIMGDESLMREVMALQNSALMQSILNDPELMGKIASGDLDSLINDPRLEKLSRESVVQKIKRKQDR